MAPSSSLVPKIKVQLKLAIARLRMVQQKDTAVAKQQRRAMAQLLEMNKEASARIRVENIIQSDIHTELLEILELYCELLLARTGLMEAKECDPGLEEPVKSIIYAAPRTEVKELHTVRGLLVEKYGKEFALEAQDNKSGKVGERIVKKLKVETPSEELVTMYLQEIARTYGINWPKESPTSNADGAEGEAGEDNDGNGGGGAKETPQKLESPLTTDELTRYTPPRDIGPKSPVSVVPPSSSTDNLSPKIKLPAPPELKPGVGMKKATPGTKVESERNEDVPRRGRVGGEGKAGAERGGLVGGKIPEVDELAKRFAALKK